MTSPTHGFDSLGDDDVLSKSRFHKLLVAFQLPAHWPGWLVSVSAGALGGVVGFLWWMLARDIALSGSIAVILLSFFAADIVLLRQLPRRRISFGSWKGQFFSLALPRSAVALFLGVSGLILGWTPTLLLTMAAQFIGTAALYRGAVVEPRRLALTHLNLGGGLTSNPSRSPVRILHISDMHMERLGEREDQLVTLARQAEPDLILLTGDYVNLSNNLDPKTHTHIRDLLGQLTARYGVFAVLGSPPVDLHHIIPTLFEGTSVRLMRDEAILVTLNRDRQITLIGLDCHHEIARDTETLDRVLAEAPGGMRVLLNHSPDLMLEAAKRGIDLYLCGHTHGGQVRLPFIGPILTSSMLGRRFVMGHYVEDRTHLYVSRGVGFEGLGAPRVRLLCPPEITLIEWEGRG